MNVEDFNNLSYDIQTKRYNSSFDVDGLGRKKAKTWLNPDTVGAWRQTRVYKSLDPLLGAYPEATWVTVGDGRYGRDANYIKEKGLKVLATNISDVLLKEAKEIGYIDAYSQENAENLSFSDREFDFVLCKEAYHHFPRPMIALYEMLRVAQKRIVLIEPTDEYWASSFSEVLLMNIKNLVKTILGKKVVRHNYEEVGNYVYSISPREIEKVAVAMNFNAVAFKGINDYYQPGVEDEKATNNSKLFKKIKRKISFQNWQCRLKLKQYSSTTAIIFKEKLKSDIAEELRKQGYKVIFLPSNPYI